jgi:inactivated superfamily I helicase
MITAWHEILPALGEFINKTGFPVGLWLITGFVVYKLGKKIFIKVEPIVDAHFELVTQLKDATGRTVSILEKQNEILVHNFNIHTDILNDHTSKLDKIMHGNIERNEILEDTKKKVIPMSNGMATAVAGASNGIKR